MVDSAKLCTSLIENIFDNYVELSDVVGNNPYSTFKPLSLESLLKSMLFFSENALTKLFSFTRRKTSER